MRRGGRRREGGQEEEGGGEARGIRERGREGREKGRGGRKRGRGGKGRGEEEGGGRYYIPSSHPSLSSPVKGSDDTA